MLQIAAVSGRGLLSGRAVWIPDAAFPGRRHVAFWNTHLLITAALVSLSEGYGCRSAPVGPVLTDSSAGRCSCTSSYHGTLPAADLMTEHGSCSAANGAANCRVATLVEIRASGEKRC